MKVSLKIRDKRKFVNAVEAQMLMRGSAVVFR